MAAEIRTIEPGGETSERLLAAAEKLILRDGAADLRVRNIGEEAHANAALVSYHFGGIQGLLAELLSINTARIHASRSEMLDQALQVRNAAGRLDALIRAYVDPIWLVQARWNDGPASTIVRACLNSIEARWRNQTVADINASVAAMAMHMQPLLPHLTRNDLVTRLRLLSGATEMLQPRLDMLGLFPVEGAISRGRQKFLSTSMLRFATGALKAP